MIYGMPYHSEGGGGGGGEGFISTYQALLLPLENDWSLSCDHGLDYASSAEREKNKCGELKLYFSPSAGG